MKPLHFAIVVAMLLGWALFAVEQRTRSVRHGYAIRHLERERMKLMDENRKLTREIAVLMRPERIASEVQRLGLALVAPSEAGDPESEMFESWVTASRTPPP